MNSRAERLGEVLVEGDDDQLLHTEGGDELGLALERGEQPGRVLRGEDDDGVGIEGEDAVGAGDDLAVAQVHPVEGSDRDAAPACGLHVGQAGDLHAGKPIWRSPPD